MVVAHVGAVLDPALALVPDRTALIVEDGATWTFAELDGEVQRVAGVLARAGVGRGDRVVLADEAGVLAIATIVACARLGACAVEVNPSLTVDELRALVEPVGARLGVAGEDARSALEQVMGGARVIGAEEVLAEAVAGSGPSVGPPPRPDDEALVLFTSGTTGRPKPVPLTHGALTRRLALYAGPLDADAPAGVDLICVPIFHIGGTFAVLLKLCQAKTMVVLPRFDAGGVLRTIEQHRVQQTWFVPTMLQRVLDHPAFATTDLSSLTRISYGAAAMPPDLIDRALEALPNVEFSNTFGQTETVGAFAALGPEGHRDPVRRRSVGQPLPGMEVRIVDPEDRGDVAPGDVGELWVRETAANDGWVHTGDLAWRDADGYLFLAGRRSLVINRGGEKFAPSEVADALRDHPLVRDVAVVGVPDGELGQRVGVAVVAEGPITLDDLRAHGQARLARFKLPERLVVVDELPYTDTGKLRPADLTALFP